jgi:hypothetical protein
LKATKYKESGELTSPLLFMNKRIFKTIIILTLSFVLNGCALINLLFQLAPLAVGVLVEYSPPLQTEEGRIICVKALRHIGQDNTRTRILESQYFLVVLDDKGTEIASTLLDVGQKYFDMDEFCLRRIGEEAYALNIKNRKWQIEIKELSVISRQLSSSKQKTSKL